MSWMRAGEFLQNNGEHHMQKLGFIAGALALLSTPGLAASALGDKPMMVAEEGKVTVSVGDRDHDRDLDRYRNHHHRRVVVIHHDHDEHEGRESHHRRVLVIHRRHDND
jgi:hypothetical protein